MHAERGSRGRRRSAEYLVSLELGFSARCSYDRSQELRTRVSEQIYALSSHDLSLLIVATIFFFIYNDTFAQFSIILQPRRRRSLEFYFGISILVENSFSTRAPF